MLCCSIRSIFYSNKTEKLTPAHENVKNLKRATNAGAAAAATAVRLLDGTGELCMQTAQESPQRLGVFSLQKPSSLALEKEEMADYQSTACA